MPVSFETLVAALSEPDFYAHAPASVEVVQTHISWVFLAGDEVFKLKKPVRFSFLDFSTAALRQHFCREEVRLNRRLAGDVYRGVLGLQDGADRLAFCDIDDPAVIEAVVHMRRLPAARMLPALLERGEVDTHVIDAIVDRLVRFHQAYPAGDAGRAAAQPERLLASMHRDFVEMNRFRDVTLPAADDDAIRNHCTAGIEVRASLLRQRCEEGRVRDGHGDLHAEHICIPSDDLAEIIIFDCIEFSPEFRYRDVAAEIAFLAMDLEHRGYPRLADHLVSTYARDTDDPEFASLVPLFACHRAYIRGKVESLKSEEEEVGDEARAAARSRASQYFQLAYRYTWRTSPALVVVYGLSGSGKSTLARALAARTGFAHLASDEIRKELAGLDPTKRVDGKARAELYSTPMSARTYTTMYARADALLRDAKGVILDATFQRRVDRDAARSLARSAGRPVLFVECVCDEDEVVRRLEARTIADDDASDASVDVYRMQRRVYEPSSTDESVYTICVDTTDSVAARAAVEAALSAALVRDMNP